MKPASRSLHLTRRTMLHGAAALAALGLTAGCATPPPPPPPPAPASKLTPAQVAALKELNFSEADTGWNLDLGARIAFGVDNASITPEDVVVLTRVAQVLLGVGIDQLTVEGHTDKQGSDAYNLRLSERRADVVAETLIAKGFAPANITRRGFGAQRPVGDNATPAGRLQNRRAVLIVPLK